jgi:hypothetical protein
MNRTHFAFRIDRWDHAGNAIMDHVAGVECLTLRLHRMFQVGSFCPVLFRLTAARWRRAIISSAGGELTPNRAAQGDWSK